MHRGKRWLYLTHRWIGIGTCLLLAMWFLSGVVMMYMPFPSLTQVERLAGLAPIHWMKVDGRSPADDYLQQGLEGPIWLGATAISATSRTPLPATDAHRAGRIASAFGHAAVLHVEAVERDQWTVAGGFDRYRPLWKVRLAGSDQRILYVASTTGTVVLDTNAAERFWNWLGSVPHWIYPTVLRKDQPLWRQVILWTAGVSIIGSASGVWIGILRMRWRRRYKGGRVSPYRNWQWWHHVMGLLGSLLLMTWIVSGWLSVDPNRWFAREGVSDAARAAYSAAGVLPQIDWQRLGQLPLVAEARRAQLIWIDGTAELLLWRTDNEPLVLDARTFAPVQFDPARLVSAARRLIPGAPVERIEWLTEPDSYWYEAKGRVELPVLRIRFADPAATWVHISPRTGAILSDMDARRRLYRWLFDALHRWDILGLITQRPLWDLWMWVWSILGTAVSVSGIVMGYRRLRPARRIQHV